ncbi:MAG: hypothetical protein HQM11_13025 [SAR324 cluster bacterium]|nr:hypothetical protein [SAR324 cluster bacterium]
MLIIGAPVSLVQAMAGHANPQTTLKHYTNKKHMLEQSLALPRIVHRKRIR